MVAIAITGGSYRSWNPEITLLFLPLASLPVRVNWPLRGKCVEIENDVDVRTDVICRGWLPSGLCWFCARGLVLISDLMCPFGDQSCFFFLLTYMGRFFMTGQKKGVVLSFEKCDWVNWCGPFLELILRQMSTSSQEQQMPLLTKSLSRPNETLWISLVDCKYWLKEVST